jgi:cytochrome b561
LSGEERAEDAATQPRQEVAPPRANTPASIVVALLLFAFAIATPVFGILGGSGKTDGFQIFGTFLLWLMAGGAAAFLGIICTIVGAVRGPHTGATTFAIVLAVLVSLPLLFFLALGLR